MEDYYLGITLEEAMDEIGKVYNPEPPPPSAFTVVEFQRASGLTIAQARTRLRQLVESGHVKEWGTRDRKKLYVIAKPLQEE